jgi:hypothetical protein
VIHAPSSVVCTAAAYGAAALMRQRSPRDGLSHGACGPVAFFVRGREAEIEPSAGADATADLEVWVKPWSLAERVTFELTSPVKDCRFSNLAPRTSVVRTRAHLP